MVKKLMAIALILTAVIIFALGVSLYRVRDRGLTDKAVYQSALKAAPAVQAPLSYIQPDNFHLKEGFTSHLPLVVLDMGGKEPQITMKFDMASGKYVELDFDPYITGSITVIDNGQENGLSDAPVLQCPISIKRRGNSSMLYEKPQYMIKFVSDTGEYVDYPLLGMGAEHEWVLNGSMTDKSMLRNYLSYRLASSVLDYTPEFAFCEVVIKTPEGYRYQGVYLLGESIKQGESRVNINNYQSSLVNTGYLIRRDRYDAQGLMLSTYATENALTYGYLGLRYPNKDKVTKETVAAIEREISNIEQILYSDDPLVFASYRQYLDIDSFVDYFVINEFFGNYDAGNNSTYMYKELGGKLKMGPVWDFDGAMDNYSKIPGNAEYLAFYTAPLYERLVKDKNFVERVQKRYAQLRRGLLSEANVVATIDAVNKHLGPAVDREWMRWNAYYAQPNKFSLGNYTDDKGLTLYRDMPTHDSEIYRIKTNLRIHGEAIPVRLLELERDCVFDTNLKSQRMFFLSLFLLIFFVPLIYINKKK